MKSLINNWSYLQRKFSKMGYRQAIQIIYFMVCIPSAIPTTEDRVVDFLKAKQEPKSNIFKRVWLWIYYAPVVGITLLLMYIKFNFRKS